MSAIDNPANSFRSLPAQNAGAAPVKTIERTSLFCSAPARAEPSCAISSEPSALRRWGRSIDTSATAPCNSDLIILDILLADACAVGVRGSADILSADFTGGKVVP